MPLLNYEHFIKKSPADNQNFKDKSDFVSSQGCCQNDSIEDKSEIQNNSIEDKSEIQNNSIEDKIEIQNKFSYLDTSEAMDMLKIYLIFSHFLKKNQRRIF